MRGLVSGQSGRCESGHSRALAVSKEVLCLRPLSQLDLLTLFLNPASFHGNIKGLGMTSGKNYLQIDFSMVS